jgi:hypothetical protein
LIGETLRNNVCLADVHPCYVIDEIRNLPARATGDISLETESGRSAEEVGVRI